MLAGLRLSAQSYLITVTEVRNRSYYRGFELNRIFGYGDLEHRGKPGEPWLKSLYPAETFNRTAFPGFDLER